MSEWLKAHAWKATPATLTERHQNTSSRNRFNDLRPADVPRCDAVNVSIFRRFESPTLHSFYTVLGFTCRVRTNILRCASTRPWLPHAPAVSAQRVYRDPPGCCSAINGSQNGRVDRPPPTRASVHPGPFVHGDHRFFSALARRGRPTFLDALDFVRTRSGSFVPPVSRFHSSNVSFEIFPSTSSCANFRRCAWLLKGMPVSVSVPPVTSSDHRVLTALSAGQR